MGRAERARLQPWRQPWASPHARLLDAEELREMLHLWRTGQATPHELAVRYGVSRRTIYRYRDAAPADDRADAAARRLHAEALRMGLRLTPADAQRLATAALLTIEAAA